jgi:hypothetical protein
MGRGNERIEGDQCPRPEEMAYMKTTSRNTRNQV